MNFGSIISALQEIGKDEKANIYLVGGYIRDIFIKGKPETLEMDFVVDNSVSEFAEKAAKKLKGSLVPLDMERGAIRVISKGEFELDFNRLKSRTIESDLRNRDFTINALACDITRIRTIEDIKDSLLDPCLGLNDIQKRSIRITNPGVFIDDPLRILRAFKFAAIFDFEIEGTTLDSIRASVAELKKIAGERIRGELSRIFETSDSIKFVQKMDELKIFDEIIPEIEQMRGVEQGPYHHLDVWKHSIESLGQLEEVINETSDDVSLASYLSKPLTDTRKTIWIAKLGALLHDIGKPGAREIIQEGKIRFYGHEEKGIKFIESVAKRLKLSNKEKTLLEDIVLFHLRPAQLASGGEVTKRATFRLLRDMRDSLPAVCLVTIADKMATRGILVAKKDWDPIEILCRQLMKEYFDMKDAKTKPKKLLTGDDIMELFHIPSSPIIGAILKEIEESQVEGSIKTEEEAIRFAKKFYERIK